MKTIGLIAGMSWKSSLEYYKIMNELVQEKLGGHHCAKIIMYNVDFEELITCQRSGNWQKAGEILSNAAQSLEKAGSDLVLICTNTMHKVADAVQESINIPLIHICDAVITQASRQNIKKVGILGTKYTLQGDFYCSCFEKNGIQYIIPDDDEMQKVHDVIFNELCLGEIKDESRIFYKKVIQNMVKKGAEGIILGCTEIQLLITQEDSPVPVFDTTYHHAAYAVELALTKELSLK
ncbi:MAG: aspartate/glutamate racemase family protein [Candidatus Gastranaerophilaceae bacterium]|jgi:aspartate racemase